MKCREADMEENTEQVIETTVEMPEEKSRRKRWKKQKKERRAALKAKYKDAPWLLKLFRLYLLKPILWLLVIGILGVALVSMLAGSGLLSEAVTEYIDTEKMKDVPQEEIYAEAPIDEEGAGRIDGLPSYPETDTWTICVYMVGSNLEDMGENDLSSVVRYVTEPIKAANEGAAANNTYERVAGFLSEVEAQGMTPPDYLFFSEKPLEASSTAITNNVIVATQKGYASTDIDEMKAATLPDNVTIVLQPCGATRWSNGLINPNKTQRFEIKGGRMAEVANLPLQDSCSVDAIADFLMFCRDNYESDHRILLFWDHGGGSFGFGCDSIFGTGVVSLAEMREALSKVYRPSEKNPPFELIGFDACLMAALETAHAFDGYGRYLAASEEVEPGSGWEHTVWLNAFAEDMNTNGAKIGRGIADSYMDYYIKQNKNVGSMIGEVAAEFSVIDIAAAEECYSAYCNLAAAALKAAVEEPGVLAQLGRAASRSTRYAETSYRIYNTIDLGMFVDGLTEDFPEEAYAVKSTLKNAVMYHRENGYLSESQGLSVYMPVQIEGIGGLSSYLSYLNTVCDSDDIRALYYYKLAGCLNEELQEYVTEQGYGEAGKLELESLRQLQSILPETDGSNYSVTVPDEAMNLIQTYQMFMVEYDRGNDTLKYLGADNFALMDDENTLSTDYSGEWVMLEDQPLALDIVDETGAYVKYRSEVMYNGKKSYLLLSYDKDSDEFSIMGVREVPTAITGNAADVADRVLTELNIGDKITPLYKVQSLVSGSTETVEGDAVKYTVRTKLESRSLADGNYLSFIVVTDPRGDEYYTNPMLVKMDGGKIAELSVDNEFTVLASAD